MMRLWWLLNAICLLTAEALGSLQSNRLNPQMCYLLDHHAVATVLLTKVLC